MISELGTKNQTWTVSRIREHGGILRRAGEAFQRGRHRRQQTRFERGFALDAFLFRDFLQHRLITIFPVAGNRRQDHGHNGFFRPFAGRGFGERRQVRQGAQRGHHFIIGTFVLTIPPPLAERFPLIGFFGWSALIVCWGAATCFGWAHDGLLAQSNSNAEKFGAFFGVIFSLAILFGVWLLGAVPTFLVWFIFKKK
jgi:hypothetical protein